MFSVKLSYSYFNKIFKSLQRIFNIHLDYNILTHFTKESEVSSLVM